MLILFLVHEDSLAEVGGHFLHELLFPVHRLELQKSVHNSLISIVFGSPFIDFGYFLLIH